MSRINWITPAILLLTCLLIIGCSSTEQVKQEIQREIPSTNGNKYFNHKNEQITVEEFISIRKTNKYLDIPLESPNHYKLIERFNNGQLESPSRFYDYLENTFGVKLDKSQIVFINYHPGLDSCNTSGSATVKSIEKWFRILDKELKKYSENDIIHIAKKDSKILERQKTLGFLYDTDGHVESYFFKQHYPCSSYVIISPDGRYSSYFGEYSDYSMLKSIKFLKVKKLK